MSLLTASDRFASIQWISSTVVFKGECGSDDVGRSFQSVWAAESTDGCGKQVFRCTVQRHGLQKASLCLNNERGVLVLTALQGHSEAAGCSLRAS